MKKRRRRPRRRVIVIDNKWERSGDPQLTRILKELQVRAEELSGTDQVPRLVKLVLARKETPELKLKLIRHLIDQDVLRKFANVNSDVEKGDQRLERAYRVLFEEWWSMQEHGFRNRPAKSRLRALENYRTQLPKKLGFSLSLQKDFDLAVRALIQELKTEQEFNPPKDAKPAGKAEKENEPSSQNDPVPERIPWIGAKNELIELFNVLIRQKKIPAVPKAEKYRYIEQHFVDENLESFTTKNLAELERITNATRTGRPKGIHALEGEIVRSFELISSVDTPED